MPKPPQTIDDYLATVTADKRTALQKLRKTIKAAAPNAEECISYRLPAFRLNGKPLVAFGAAANHCALYPMSSSAVKAHKSELKNYSTSTGTIRFHPAHPLPAALVRALVKYRIAELRTPYPCGARRNARTPSREAIQPRQGSRPRHEL
jgi:uncharacterized protein YdhG (YjbR/CyaY superfamily)